MNDTTLLVTSNNENYREKAIFGFFAKNRTSGNFLVEEGNVLVTNKKRPKCVEKCPGSMIYQQGNECHPCHKNCHPETTCSGPENFKCEINGENQCRYDSLNMARVETWVMWKKNNFFSYKQKICHWNAQSSANIPCGFLMASQIFKTILLIKFSSILIQLPHLGLDGQIIVWQNNALME